jgi:hypothetical protein
MAVGASGLFSTRDSTDLRATVFLKLLPENHMIRDEQSVDPGRVCGLRLRKHRRPIAGIFSGEGAQINGQFGARLRSQENAMHGACPPIVAVDKYLN